MYSFFPHLKELTVYVVEQQLKGNSDSTNPLSLKRVAEEFSTELKPTSMVTYEEALKGRAQGVGFECHWLDKDGIERCFVMEKTSNSQKCSSSSSSLLKLGRRYTDNISWPSLNTLDLLVLRLLAS
jgi:hypothetical protein